ncbi:Signal-transducing adaptor protein 2 [Acipenser ruthenus]|uniref:Signal-transducing adaptor protein 2 n=1 Tax=Acipenser ruthenus TaxID=7906 RepID=A0A444UWI3_ACIRT|nr:Signal-transducing adaptor protein 2 [Acipenser ruthenus]
MSGYICPLSVSLSPQEHKRYWTSLIGDTLFFFNNSRDTTLAVPHSLTLLPGQIHLLQEVLSEEEKRRRKQEESAAPPAGSPANCTEQETDLPSCFNKVSRTEAESLLEKYPDCGNLLLRPGRDGQSYAVSTRQELNG